MAQATLILATGKRGTAMLSDAQIITLGQEAGLEVARAHWSHELWTRTLAQCAYVPVAYTPPVLTFQDRYFSEYVSRLDDLSLVVTLGGQPVGLWPLSVVTAEGQSRLSAQGLYCLPPLWVETLPPRARARLVAKCKDLAARVSETLGADCWESQSLFVGEDRAGLADWPRQAMMAGADPRPDLALYVDLRQAPGDLQGNFRKSFKPLIKQGLKLWGAQVHSGTQTEDWAAFQALHRRVAGRATRSQATWDCQYEALTAGHGMLVTLRDGRDTLVGAGYFTLSATEANYSVAAYDRDLFDKPLGHVVQHHAIATFQAWGLPWYRLGRVSAGRQTPKERAINEFKSGFASHSIPEFVFTHRGADAG
ncbi:FemAB family protein [Anianabacter salinae]|uniref:FemAB family protein n=1 Tax=Anianabacter salinae TaxID=2851023 RepID=UPI00225E6C9C|nr:FemAB family protein [Anianabacter salinae]MBV0914172.1 FemAB family protein [Anianabacter salinae]